MLTIEQRLDKIEATLYDKPDNKNIFGLFVFNPDMFVTPFDALEAGQLYHIDFDPHGGQKLKELDCVLHTVCKALMFAGSVFKPVLVVGENYFTFLDEKELDFNLTLKQFFEAAK